MHRNLISQPWVGIDEPREESGFGFISPRTTPNRIRPGFHGPHMARIAVSVIDTQYRTAYPGNVGEYGYDGVHKIYFKRADGEYGQVSTYGLNEDDYEYLKYLCGHEWDRAKQTFADMRNEYWLKRGIRGSRLRELAFLLCKNNRPYSGWFGSKNLQRPDGYAMHEIIAYLNNTL